jgi:DNA-binding response OmpR family regulator
VKGATTGAEALRIARKMRPDLILLDIMLPGESGIEVCERIRERDQAVVIVMITAKDAEEDKVRGFEAGADDYVTKPFSPKEVVARIRSVLRRAGSKDAGEEPLSFGELEILPRSREVRLDGTTLSLTPKEFDVLPLLASNHRRVFTRLDILEELWDFAFDGDPSTVTVHIRRLREKIERDPSRPRHIVTVWGVGYRFDP